MDGYPVRHAVEVRHDSFRVAEFVALLRAYNVAVVVTDSDGFPQIPDVTASFVYARLQRCSEDVETGYTTRRSRRGPNERVTGRKAIRPKTFPAILDFEQPPPRSRDVFLYMINGFKPRAPIAAMALIERSFAIVLTFRPECE